MNPCQTILPLPNLVVPPRHVALMQLANAASYPERRSWFYPFKTRLLRARGLGDGLDLQVIVQKCWCGDGIWRGREDDLPQRLWQSCDKCGGTGIYATRHIVLLRWQFGTALFHEPTTLISHHSGRQYRERFDGLIQHAQVPPAAGRRAMEKLMLRYAPRSFYALWLARWRDWRDWKVIHARWRIRRVRKLMRFVPELEDEVPF